MPQPLLKASAEGASVHLHAQGPQQLNALCARTGEKGSVWSFNFFFYNRKLRRILYFACRGIAKTALADSSAGDVTATPGATAESADAESADGLDESDSLRYGMAGTMDV